MKAKKMMKPFLMVMLFLCTSLFAFADKSVDYKEGDIVFQISKSKQSPLIQYATKSFLSHCGIIVEKNNKFYVLEASNRVKLTDIDSWINRGRFGLVVHCRVFNKPVKIKYAKYLGMPYDLSFKFNNNKMYCSELVYEIYKNQFGIELCRPRQVKSYRLFGIRNKLKQRGISENQMVVAPCDLLDYPHYLL